MGPSSPAVLLVMGHRLAIQYGGLHGSSAAGQGDGAWFDSGYMVCVSVWVLVPYCFFYVKGNSDPEVLCLAPWCVGLRVTLMEKCAQSTLQLPSELVVARGIWTFTLTSPLYLAVPVHCLGVLFLAQCLVQQYMLCVSSGFSTVCRVKVDLYPEVDSRPALLGPRSLEKCAQFRFWLLELLHWEIWTFLSEPRVFGSHCTLFQRGGGVAGSLDSQVTLHQFVSETAAVITPVDKHMVEHASETTTTTAAAATATATTTTVSARA